MSLSQVCIHFVFNIYIFVNTECLKNFTNFGGRFLTRNKEKNYILICTHKFSPISWSELFFNLIPLDFYLRSYPKQLVYVADVPDIKI